VGFGTQSRVLWAKRVPTSISYDKGENQLFHPFSIKEGFIASSFSVMPGGLRRA